MRHESAVIGAQRRDEAVQRARIGGKPYLFHLVSSVPAASNASYYARIVEETALGTATVVPCRSSNVS